MLDKQILYYVVLILGAITTRADLVRLTDGSAKDFASANRFRYILGIIAGVAYTSVAIWGFFQFKWYIALFSFIFISLGFGLLVNRGTLSPVIMIKPILEVIIITLATLIWII